MLSLDTIERMIGEGKGHQIQKVLTVANATTVYHVLDFTACTGKVYARPLLIKPNQGILSIETYGVDSYTGGTAVTFNTMVDDTATAKTVSKTGVTPGTGSYNKREYFAGTKSTNQSSGSGIAMGDTVAKELSTAKPVVVKITNPGAESIDYEFGFVWVES